MKLTRSQALTMFQNLRALDGYAVNTPNGPTLIPYRFSAKTVDALVDNTLALQPIVNELEARKAELARRYQAMTPDVPLNESNPQWMDYVNSVTAYLAEECEVDLTLVFKTDWNADVNPIPLSVRLALIPMTAPAK